MIREAERGAQRGPEPAEGIPAELAVPGHGLGHQGMGDLQEQGGRPARQEHPLSRDTPDERIGPESPEVVFSGRGDRRPAHRHWSGTDKEGGRTGGGT